MLVRNSLKLLTPQVGFSFVCHQELIPWKEIKIKAHKANFKVIIMLSDTRHLLNPQSLLRYLKLNVFARIGRGLQ